MTPTNPQDTLNRLLTVEVRSLPMYVVDTHHLASHLGHPIADAVYAIAADQQEIAGRIVRLLDERGFAASPDGYPMAFTDTHDLSLEFLVSELIGYQRRDVATLERAVASLANDREARELAQHALGSAKAHLESLEELARQPAG